MMLYSQLLLMLRICIVLNLCVIPEESTIINCSLHLADTGVRSRTTMVYSSYKLQRILYHSLRGHGAPTISRLLCKENLSASCVGIANFLKKYSRTCCIGRSESEHPTKITAEIKAIVNE